MKNSKNSTGKKIPVYINNDKATFGDVRDLSINPDTYVKASTELTKSISARKRYCRNDTELIELDNALCSIEKHMTGFTFVRYNTGNPKYDGNGYHPQRYIIYQVNKIADINSIKEKLIKDEYTFSCFHSNRVDSLTAIFKLDEVIYNLNEYEYVMECYRDIYCMKYLFVFELHSVGYPIIIPYDPEFYVNYNCTALSTEMLDVDDDLG